MMTASSVGVAVRALLIVLFCVIVASYVYVFAIGGYLSCFDFTVRWAIALAMDFTIYTAVLSAWVFYKESSWIKTVIFVVLLYILGSILTIGYILVQFFKLSREEFSEDPIYYVLARHHKREHKSGNSVVTAKAIYSTLACLTLGVFIYTLIIDISGLHASFSRCFITYMVDIYIHALVLSIWIAYKESSWITASLWIISHVVFGSIILCVYIVRKLFSLSPGQPASSIIFKSNDPDFESSNPLLTSDAINV